MQLEIDKVILSANDDPNYIDFWPLVASAYAKILKIPVLLAFVTDRNENDSYIQKLRQYGEVVLYKRVDGVPAANQAKMARFYLASKQSNDVCYIDDIDLLPLNRDFIAEKVKGRPQWHLLCVGAEFWAYGNNGCFPVSQMTAEGLIFKDLFNPRNLDYHDFIQGFVGHSLIHPTRENILNTVSPNDGDCFSDECVIRALRKINGVKEIHKKRDFDWEKQTIDRGFWHIFDVDKLYRHEYIFAHFARPISDPTNMRRMDILMQYIIDTYEKNS